MSKIDLLQKNVCFWNLAIVLENFDIGQMIGNGFFHFCIFKTKSIFLKLFTHTHDSDRRLCPKGQMYCIHRKKYPSCQTLPVLRGVHSNHYSALV